MSERARTRQRSAEKKHKGSRDAPRKRRLSEIAPGLKKPSRMQRETLRSRATRGVKKRVSKTKLRLKTVATTETPNSKSRGAPLAFRGWQRGRPAPLRPRRRARRSRRPRGGAALRGCRRTWRRGRSPRPSPAQGNADEIRPSRSRGASPPRTEAGPLQAAGTAAGLVSQHEPRAKCLSGRTSEKAEWQLLWGAGAARACWHSSLVGTSTSPLGESWAGPADSSTCRSGRRYAAVLPLPVLAWAMTSCGEEAGRECVDAVPRWRLGGLWCSRVSKNRVSAHLALQGERDRLGLHGSRRGEPALRCRPHHARVEAQRVHGASQTGTERE